MAIKWDLIREDVEETCELIAGFVIFILGILLVLAVLFTPVLAMQHYGVDLLESMVYSWGSIGIFLCFSIRYTTWFENSSGEDEEGVSADD